MICDLFPNFCNFSKYCNYSLYINLQNYLSISITYVNIYLQIPRSAREIGPCCLMSAGPDFRPPAPIRTVCGIAPAGVAHDRPGKTAASTKGRHPAAACVAQGRRACCLLRWCGCGCMVGLAARGRRWRWRCTLARAPRSRTGASSGTGALPYTTTARRYSGVIALALHVVRPGVGASGFGCVRGLAAGAPTAVSSAAAGALFAIKRVAACARCHWAVATLFSKFRPGRADREMSGYSMALAVAGRHSTPR